MTTKITVHPSGKVEITVGERFYPDEHGIVEEAGGIDMTEAEPEKILGDYYGDHGPLGPDHYGPHNMPPNLKPVPDRPEDSAEAYSVSAAIARERRRKMDEIKLLGDISRLLYLAGLKHHPKFWDNKIETIAVVVKWARSTIDGAIVPWPELLKIKGITAPKQYQIAVEKGADLSEAMWLRLCGFDAGGGGAENGYQVYIDVPAAEAHLEVQRLMGLIKERGWDEGAYVRAEIHAMEEEEGTDGLPKPHMAVLLWRMGHVERVEDEQIKGKANIVWEDEVTGTQLIRTPEYHRYVWYIDGVVENDVMNEKMPGVVARYEKWKAEQVESGDQLKGYPADEPEPGEGPS